MTDVLFNLCDDKGFLKDWQAWTPELAEQIAQVEGISLTEAHWEIILLLREYYGPTRRRRPIERWLIT